MNSAVDTITLKLIYQLVFLLTSAPLPPPPPPPHIEMDGNFITATIGQLIESRAERARLRSGSSDRRGR